MTPEDYAALTRWVVQSAGGYLRNVIREPLVTCAVCGTPVTPGWSRCRPCDGRTTRGGLADRVASITYAISGQQSGRLMRMYKSELATEHQRALVGILLLLATHEHMSCLNAVSFDPVTAWAHVPSLSGRPGTHPLHPFIAGALPSLPEVPLVASKTVTDPRALRGDHFSTISSLDDEHVLLIDDTWASGGHVQSAALTLHAAGAAEVSVLTVARWLEPSFGNTASFISDRLTADFDAGLCPWTAGECPRQTRSLHDRVCRRVRTLPPTSESASSSWLRRCQFCRNARVMRPPQPWVTRSQDPARGALDARVAHPDWPSERIRVHSHPTD